jgi:hypothetical protein
METSDHSVAAREAAQRPEPTSDEQDGVSADRSSYVDAVLFRRRSTRPERARAMRKVRAAHEPERI